MSKTGRAVHQLNPSFRSIHKDLVQFARQFKKWGASKHMTERARFSFTMYRSLLYTTCLKRTQGGEMTNVQKLLLFGRSRLCLKFTLRPDSKSY